MDSKPTLRFHQAPLTAKSFFDAESVPKGARDDLIPKTLHFDIDSSLEAAESTISWLIAQSTGTHEEDSALALQFRQLAQRVDILDKEMQGRQNLDEYSAFPTSAVELARSSLLDKIYKLHIQATVGAPSAVIPRDEQCRKIVMDLCTCNKISCAAAFMLLADLHKHHLNLTHQQQNLPEAKQSELDQLRQDLQTKRTEIQTTLRDTSYRGFQTQQAIDLANGWKAAHDNLQKELAEEREQSTKLQQDLLDTRALASLLQSDVRGTRALYDKLRADINDVSLVESLPNPQSQNQTTIDLETQSRLATAEEERMELEELHQENLLRKLMVEKHDDELAKLRGTEDRLRKAKQELRDQLVELQSQYDALETKHRDLQNRHDSRGRENSRLKKNSSEAGVTELNERHKEDLRKLERLEETIRELRQTIKGIEDDQAFSIDTPTATVFDSTVLQQAQSLNLDSFTLSRPRPSASYTAESARLLRYLARLTITAMASAKNFSESRQGQGWSAYQQLESLLGFVQRQTAEAANEVLKLDRYVKMESEGFPKLSLGREGR